MSSKNFMYENNVVKNETQSKVIRFFNKKNYV